MKFTFYNHELFEMARIGTISNNVEVMIYENEGPIPHFHFRDRQTNRNGCIRLDKSEYFIHNKYNSTLSRKEIKSLCEWVNSTETPFKKFGLNISVYTYMVTLWNENNPNFKVDDNLSIPDYSLL